MATQKELLAWAAAVISQAQSSKIHGSVVISLEAGAITRVKTEKIERPPA